MTSLAWYCDTRMGGKEQWVYGNPGKANMRLSDGITRNIAYICTKNDGNEYDSRGTGFFVCVDAEGTDELAHIYIVTAKHNLDLAGSNVFIRVNTKNGGVKYFKIDEGWEISDRPGSDVAVLYWEHDDDELDYVCRPVAEFATLDKIKEYGIGIGDDIFAVGLFSRHAGRQRNLPIVRHGIIAAVPEEPIKRGWDVEYYAYLIEMLSIGGLSGSPVYVSLHWQRKVPGTDNRWNSVVGGNVTFLLGMIHGHWDEKQPLGDPTKVNMGIGIVIPAQDILDIINKEIFVEQRKLAENKFWEANAPTLDWDDGDDDHASRFLSAVKALATTPKSEFDKEEQERKNNGQQRKFTE